MKHFLAACCLSAAIVASPASASGLSDPVVEREVIIAEAERDSSKDDGLIIALWLGLVLAAAGGAF